MKIDLSKPTIWIIAGVVALVWWLSREAPAAAGGDPMDPVTSLALGGGSAGAPPTSIAPDPIMDNPRVTPWEPPPVTRQPGDPVDVPRVRPDPNVRIGNGGTITYPITNPVQRPEIM